MPMLGPGPITGPTTTPSSAAAAGEQYCSYTIGEGTYRIFAASIHTDNAYDEEARISVIVKDATGNESELSLDSGTVSDNSPFALKEDRLVTGPGSIRGYVINLEATSFDFIVSAQKVRFKGGTVR